MDMCSAEQNQEFSNWKIYVRGQNVSTAMVGERDKDCKTIEEQDIIPTEFF